MGLGAWLRHWRRVRGKSQLDLSLDAGVSQRHISFVESGRSVPGRDLLLALLDALRVPLRDRNDVLLAAGYAPVYREEALDGPAMTVVLRAVDRILTQQEPHPALVLDRYWQVVRANEAAARFFGQFVNLAEWPKPRNLLQLMMSPTGLRPSIENWEQVAAGLLERVRREAPAGLVDARMAGVLRELEEYPGVRELRRAEQVQGPIVPVVFRKGEERWEYFSLVSWVGMTGAITAQEVRVECMFPVA